MVPIERALTSAPRRMSSSTTSARPASAARCNGVEPNFPPRPLTAAPFARCRSMAPRSPAATPVQQHRAEEAAHDEEERHPEAVDGGEDDPETGILLTIRDDPDDGMNDRDACRTIPSSMATARRASRSDRRAKAGSSMVREDMVVKPPELFTIRDHVRSGQKSPFILLIYFNSTSWGKGCQLSMPEGLTEILVDLLDCVMSQRSDEFLDRHALVQPRTSHRHRLEGANDSAFRYHRRRKWATSSGQVDTIDRWFLSLCNREATGRASNQAGGSHLQAGSSQPAKDGSDTRGMGGPRSIETRNKIHACMAHRWNKTKKKTVLRIRLGRDQGRSRCLVARSKRSKLALISAIGLTPGHPNACPR